MLAKNLTKKPVGLDEGGTVKIDPDEVLEVGEPTQYMLKLRDQGILRLTKAEETAEDRKSIVDAENDFLKDTGKYH